MISTDRNIFDKNSAVARRQIDYAKNYEEVNIIVFTKKGKSCGNDVDCNKECGKTVDKSINDVDKSHNNVEYSGENKWKEMSLSNNVFVYPTNSNSRLGYIFNALRLGRFISERRNITHITCQDPFETGLVGTLVKNRYKIKSTGLSPELELQIHTDIGSKYFQNFNLLNKIRTIISKYTLTRADSVRVVSEKIKEYIKNYIDESKITVRPIDIGENSIKSLSFEQIKSENNLHNKYPQFSKIILMISRLGKEKNIDGAIESFKIAKEKLFNNKNINIGLIIVGNGQEKDNLIKLSIKLGLKDSIIFEDWQKDPIVLASYYKTCDIFLNTSWYEGYGMTLKEAEASKCNIISTDVGIAREVGAKIVDFDTNNIAREIINLL